MEFETETQFESNQKTYNLKFVISETDKSSEVHTGGIFNVFKGIIDNLGTKEQNKNGLKNVMNKIVEYIQNNNKNESKDLQEKQKPQMDEIVNEFTEFFIKNDNNDNNLDNIMPLFKNIIKNTDMDDNLKTYANTMLNLVNKFTNKSDNETESKSETESETESKSETESETESKSDINASSILNIINSFVNESTNGSETETESKLKDLQMNKIRNKSQEKIKTFLESAEPSKMKNNVKTIYNIVTSIYGLYDKKDINSNQIPKGVYNLHIIRNKKLDISSFSDVEKWATTNNISVSHSVVEVNDTVGFMSSIFLVKNGFSIGTLQNIQNVIDIKKLEDWVLEKIKDSS